MIKDLQEALRKTVVSVTFKKIDGSDRTILATLNPMLIPKDMMPKTNRPDPDVSDNEVESLTTSVFEVNLQEWRSFRKDSVIEWHINQGEDA